ncbi:hypothetical protein AX15_005964 [Amanita polypyramis BW_CC]|nr:hypothetical protein AX15_005964 [Amanita polypyramis BW_CC]
MIRALLHLKTICLISILGRRKGNAIQNTQCSPKKPRRQLHILITIRAHRHQKCPGTPLGPEFRRGEGESISQPPSCAASPRFPNGDEEGTQTDEETKDDELGDGEQGENSDDNAESYEDEMQDMRYTARPVSEDAKFPHASLPIKILLMKYGMLHSRTISMQTLLLGSAIQLMRLKRLT